MESSVRVGKYIFSVGSDEELAAFVEAANQLKRERVLQKIERQKAAAEIVTAFDQYVADYGPVMFMVDNTEVLIDYMNVCSVAVVPTEEDD
jgi:hypothetical protein